MPVDDTGVLNGREVTAVVGFGRGACVLADGSVFCWGYNYFGQLGNGTTQSSLVPVAVDISGVLRGKTVTKLADGGGTRCVLASGHVYCWGNYTIIGREIPGQSSAAPVEIDMSGALKGKTITDLEMGNGTACVIAGGAPYCWGANGNFGLGAGIADSESKVPVAVVTSGALAGKSVTDIVVGAGSSCVLASGAPYCWGGNYSGELGIGTVGGRYLPVPVYTGGALAGRTITGLGGGTHSLFAITAEPAGLPTAPGTFTALEPSRVLDTRVGLGAAAHAVAGQGQVVVRVTGIGNVPANASAVAMNLTVTGSAKGGHLTAYPTGQTIPTTSTLNFPAGRTVANMTITPVGSGGRISILNGSVGSAQVVADITGYYLGGTPTTPGAFRPLRPARLLDTRFGLGAARGAVAALGTVDLKPTGVAGIPATGVSAVVLNVTATRAVSNGYVTAFPAGAARPRTSNLNFTRGSTIAAHAVVPLGQGGRISFFNGSSGSLHLIADVAGYYLAGTPTAAGAFVPVTPARLIDSRIGLGSSGRLASLADTAVTSAGSVGLPRWAAKATMLTVTVVAPTAGGFAALRPATAIGPARTSTVNFPARINVANSAVTPAFSKLTNGSGGTLHVVVDVFGYFHN